LGVGSRKEKYNLGILTKVYGIEYRSPPEFIEKFTEKGIEEKKEEF